MKPVDAVLMIMMLISLTMLTVLYVIKEKNAATHLSPDSTQEHVHYV